MVKLTIDDLELDDSVFNEINSRIVLGVSKAFELQEERAALPRYMTKQQAAKYMGCSFNTLQKYIGLGLKVCQVDSVVRLDKNDCDTFMEDNKK
ncbi:DNA-binding protein [Enterococcus faecalis]|uniref:DNA-binding protein n=1 Tax=Enterococcus faecalis TaxID=1351 RepID=UPI000ABEDB9E|nr:DNA-binding protein [Enterococcus faecalis]